MVDCNQVLDQLSDYLDEEARAELCRAIEEHLKHCHNCRFEVDTIRKTIVLYQADRQTEMPLAVSARLQAALGAEYQRKAARSRD